MLIDDLINLSSLARKLKPFVDMELHNDVKTGSIVMALKRLVPVLQTQVKAHSKKLKNISGNLNIRLNLCIYTFENSNTITLAHMALLDKLSCEKNNYHTVSRGVYETSIVIGSENKHHLESIFEKETLLIKVRNLSCISIKLGTEYLEIPGVYNLIFSKLTWIGINVLEVFTTAFEISVFVFEKDTTEAFACIKEIFVKKTVAG